MLAFANDRRKAKFVGSGAYRASDCVDPIGIGVFGSVSCIAGKCCGRALTATQCHPDRDNHQQAYSHT